MGHNVESAQELQQEIAQRRALLEQELAKVQTLQGKEALLANIIEENAHWTQVSVLSQLHLCHVKEIKFQSDEI